MLNIVKRKNKAMFFKTETTLGSEIIKLSIIIGRLGEQVLSDRKEKNPHHMLNRLIEVQHQISALYSKLRFGHNLIQDEAYNRIVNNNFASISKEYNKIDTVWLYVRSVSSMGEMFAKFGIRTQPQEYQYLVKDLAKLQAYISIYILRIGNELKMPLGDLDRVIMDYAGTKENVVNEQKVTKPLSSKAESKKVKKEEIKPVKEEKKNQKKQSTAKPKSKTKSNKNINESKPPVPDEREIKNILSRLLPKDDAQKAEPVDEETMKKIMRGEI